MLHLANDSRHWTGAWLGSEPPRERLQGGVVEGEHEMGQVLERFWAVLRVDPVHPLQLADPRGALDAEHPVGAQAPIGQRMVLERLVVGRPPLPRRHPRTADQHHRVGSVKVDHTGPGAIPPRDWHLRQVGQQQPALVG